jgi:hypothetical protein
MLLEGNGVVTLHLSSPALYCSGTRTAPGCLSVGCDDLAYSMHAIPTIYHYRLSYTVAEPTASGTFDSRPDHRDPFRLGS